MGQVIPEITIAIAVLHVKKDGTLGHTNKKMIRNMKNRCFLRNCVAIFALCVSAYCSCFAQGAVVTYATGRRYQPQNNVVNAFPSNDQLDKLTHVIAMGIGNIFEFLKNKIITKNKN